MAVISKNFLLNRAILDGYGSKLMVGRFPLAVIHIQIDPYLADVNVHPTKQEVRNFQGKRTDGAGFRSYRKEPQGTDLDSRCLGNLAKSAVRNHEKVEQRLCH